MEKRAVATDRRIFRVHREKAETPLSSAAAGSANVYGPSLNPPQIHSYKSRHVGYQVLPVRSKLRQDHSRSGGLFAAQRHWCGLGIAVERRNIC